MKDFQKQIIHLEFRREYINLNFYQLLNYFLLPNNRFFNYE